MSLLSAEDDVSSQDSTLQDEEAGYQTNATSPSVREGTLVDISTEETLEPQPLEPRPPRALSMRKTASAQESHQEGNSFSLDARLSLRHSNSFQGIPFRDLIPRVRMDRETGHYLCQHPQSAQPEDSYPKCGTASGLWFELPLM